MASKKNKQAKNEGLASMPVLPITLTFVSVLKPEYRKDAKDRITEVGGVDITKLAEKKVTSITVERLKGFQYSKEFTALLNEPNAMFYENDGLFLATPNSEVPVKASLRTITDGVGLLSWMLNNAPKLYLSAKDQKLGNRIYDRNYAEICGAFHATDLTKSYISKDSVKYVKQDIKEVAAAQAVVTAEEHNSSPIRQIRNSVYALPGIAEKVEARKEAAAALKAANKAKLIK